jgi:hypothetical protein
LFPFKNPGSSVSLTIPVSSPNTKIKGLNLCTVYTINEQWISGVQMFTIIHNETKNLKLIYSPTCYGLSKSGEDIIWLSLWRFHLGQLDEGDKVELSMLTMPGFEVKEVGIRVVYEDEEKRDTESSCTEIVIRRENYHWDDFVPMKVSKRRGTEGVIGIGYLGCGLDFILQYVP